MKKIAFYLLSFVSLFVTCSSYGNPVTMRIQQAVRRQHVMQRNLAAANLAKISERSEEKKHAMQYEFQQRQLQQIQEQQK